MSAPAWPEWTGPRVRTAAAWLGVSLAVGTALAAATYALAFDEFADSQTRSPLGPLCLLAGALAYLAAPVAIARRRGRRGPVALVALAIIPLGALAAAIVATN